MKKGEPYKIVLGDRLKHFIGDKSSGYISQNMDDMFRVPKNVSEKFEKLSVTMKPAQEVCGLYAKMIDNGKVYSSEITERNLFVGLDLALKKIVTEIKK